MLDKHGYSGYFAKKQRFLQVYDKVPDLKGRLNTVVLGSLALIEINPNLAKRKKSLL